MVTYADDGYIKGNLSEGLQVLVDFKCVFKEDAGLEVNISKTVILPKLTQFSGEVSLDSFLPDGFVVIGVSIGTDTFVRQFVVKTYRDIIHCWCWRYPFTV